MLSSSCDILQYMVADGLLSADCPCAALSADGYHFPEPLVVNAFLSALLDWLIWSPRGSLVLAEAGKGLCHWCRCLAAQPLRGQMPAVFGRAGCSRGLPSDLRGAGGVGAGRAPSVSGSCFQGRWYTAALQRPTTHTELDSAGTESLLIFFLFIYLFLMGWLEACTDDVGLGWSTYKCS